MLTLPIPMNDTLPTLRIWQQNVNKSLAAQTDLLHSATPDKFDILAIQEPYLDHLHNTRATYGWSVIYPAIPDTDRSGRVRSVILVSTRISTNSFHPIRIPNPDVSAVSLRVGAADVHLFNLYVDQYHDHALQATARATRKLPDELGREQHIIWLGDFNRHSPRWDNPRNDHLFSNASLARAQVLINMVADYDLYMALPPSIPTLESTRT